MAPGQWSAGEPIWYWADGNPTEGDWTKPKPSIHMPRWASRLTLTVSDVRVQRLQDCSDDDAAAEGLTYLDDGPGAGFWIVDGTPVCSAGSVEAYAQLWNHINGDGAWEANPWIVAITFTVEKRNIDALQVAALATTKPATARLAMQQAGDLARTRAKSDLKNGPSHDHSTEAGAVP